ncbi:cohesin complex protein, putative [Bodo saltans]|uniref:Cohesin complex protein, putative n=1 Tax=Bodo saltans TaxID=75058 RepID=A0A0S4ISV4_BODSA|nr:cohesin complex protein, putative [Bodo saltans]|eukprot:CUG06207.1 cohesin complex protein, putative [Bodo saltans]
MPPKSHKKSTPKASPKQKAATQSSPDNEEEVAPQQPEVVVDSGATQRSAATTEALVDALVSGAVVSSTVEVILKKYREEDPEGTLCAIINAVCKASGVQEVEVDPATLRNEENIVTTLEELFARVPQESAAYFLVNKDVKYKRFRKSFPQFFERLVIVAYAGDVLFDNTLLSVILQWLLAMTESKARSFRHTSTVAILSIMEGLNDRIQFMKETIQSLKKKEAAAAQKKLDTLVKLQEHIFTSAVHQRVKDVAPEIRLAVLQTLKSLCLASPDTYVVNHYLRYFSIALYDKKPELRAEGLEAIIQIMGNHSSSVPRMRDFLKYFAERLVEMVNDVDSKCADLAIKINALIVRTDTESGETEETATLSNELIDKILLSLFDDRSGIRNAAGTFLKVFIRCRVGDDENASQVRAELLCTFASIFRNSYRQEQPEKYLVDALWRTDNPPAILTDYKPLLSIVLKGEEADASIALAIIAALIGRLKEPLSFGPSPKDDIKQARVPDASKDADATALRVKLSKDTGVVLAKVLEAHPDSLEILSAVSDVLSSMDLHVFTTNKENEKLCEAFEAYRKSVATLAITESSLINKCVRAWYAIAFTEFPQQDAAKVQLNELVKQSLSQLQAVDRAGSTRSSQDSSQSAKRIQDLEKVWSRLQILSSLLPLKDQWILVKAAFQRYTAAASGTSVAVGASVLLAKLIPIASQSVLWQRAELEVDPSLNPEKVHQETADVLENLLTVALWEADETRSEPGVLEARVEALGFFADLASLPQSNLAQGQQEQFVEICSDLLDSIQGELKEGNDALKLRLKALAGGFDATNTSMVLAGRSLVSKWEAALARVATALVRLFAFNKVSDKLAPQALLLWTRSHVKAVADVFKALFHTIRDRSADAFEFQHIDGARWSLACLKVGSCTGSRCHCASSPVRVQ